MIKHRADSIQKLNDEQAAEAKKDKTIAEQADTIELLKGCIMELADVPKKLRKQVEDAIAAIEAAANAGTAKEGASE